MTIHPNPSDFTPPKPRHQWWLYCVIGTILIGTGFGLGRLPADGPTTPARNPSDSETDPTIVTETVEVEVPVTPPSCYEAIDIAKWAFTSFADALAADMAGDYYGAQAILDEVSAEVPRWQATSTDCQSS